MSMFFPIIHPLSKEKIRNKNSPKPLRLVKPSHAGFIKIVLVLLHLIEAFITVKPIALGFSYTFKGPLYRSLPTSDGTRFGYLGP
jgi:hypothetical protein